ncbi:MAG: nickel insertion protein [Bryobacteraceae bacterium]
MMKKGRPGIVLRVIARPEDREALAQLVFAETTTLGLRFYSAERRVQARRIEDVETAHGTVRVKLSESGAFAPEYEDCRKIAQERGIPLRAVMAEAALTYLKKTK